MFRRPLPLPLTLLLLACQPKAPAEAPVTLGDGADDAAISISSTPLPPPGPLDYLKTTSWPEAELGTGEARISCEYDYVSAAMARGWNRCRSTRWWTRSPRASRWAWCGCATRARSAPASRHLVQRVAAVADRLEIPTRILDIDSSGGHVEEAIRAGDSMAEQRWAIWVREGSQCHSSCVLILASGDMRSIAGKVGIHRLFRDQSRATSRAELSAELRGVNEEVREYLVRNGADVRIAEAIERHLDTVDDELPRSLLHDVVSKRLLEPPPSLRQRWLRSAQR